MARCIQNRHVSVLLSGLLVLSITLPLPSQALQAKTVLSPALIAVALAQQGLDVSADRVEMPSSLIAWGTPQLRIDRAELIAPQKMRLRLSCTQAGQCQPFLVTVNTTSAASGIASLSNLSQTSANQANAQRSNGDRLLAGQHVTLLMQDAHMRILLPVIAMDSGISGAEIRVASPDRKQIYRAVVESPKTVRGVLP